MIPLKTLLKVCVYPDNFDVMVMNVDNLFITLPRVCLCILGDQGCLLRQWASLLSPCDVL